MSSFSYNDLLNLAAKFPPAPVIRPSKIMVEQFRFPKSKKRRIRRKWAKRAENWRPMTKALFDKETNEIYIHPDMLTLVAHLSDPPPDTRKTINKNLYNLL
jgi:hypothetical protein